MVHVEASSLPRFAGIGERVPARIPRLVDASRKHCINDSSCRVIRVCTAGPLVQVLDTRE